MLRGEAVDDMRGRTDEIMPRFRQKGRVGAFKRICRENTAAPLRKGGTMRMMMQPCRESQRVNSINTTDPSRKTGLGTRVLWNWGIE